MTGLPVLLQRFAARLDTAGVFGIGCAVFAAAVFVSAVLPAREQLAQQQRQSAQRQAAPQDAARAAVQRAGSQLEQFNRHFPSAAEVPSLVQKLHEIAAQNAVALDSGEYRMLRDRDSGLSRYQVVLPLRGSYWQVRLFVAQVLDEMAAGTLDEIVIRRDSVGARAVETRVRFTFYLGAGA